MGGVSGVAGDFMHSEISNYHANVKVRFFNLIISVRGGHCNYLPKVPED